MSEQEITGSRGKIVDLAVSTIEELTIERNKLQCAIRDLLAFWDRRNEHGWNAADIKRIEEIRKLVNL